SVGRFAYHNFLDWEIEPKMEWLRRELDKAGGEAWFQSIVYGAIVEGRRVTGVAVATPLGNGAVLAREVVDATGSADVAIAAGAPYEHLAHEHFTVQGTGLSDRNPDTSYNNSDWCVADDADPVDCTRMLAAGHKKYRTVFDTSPLIGTRERRRIVGEYTLQPMDIILHRRFRDSICHARSNFDAHSYYIHPLFRYWFSSVHDVFWCYVPYRCLLPCDVEHVIVTGLALSVHRDGLPVVRMQPDMQNQGYAAGLAAALCAQGGIAPRELPVRELQQRLVEVGCLDAEVLDHEDTPPPTAEQARHAAMRLDKPADIALLFAAPPETARTALKAIFPRCTNVWQRLLTAEMLACFGDASGFAELREHLASDKEDEGQQFPRMSRTGHVSGYGGTDAVVVSIADTGHPDAAAAIGSFISRLNPGTNYSHFWAAAWACGELADARLAAPLAACLRMPGMSGHQITTQQEMNDRTSDVASPGSKVDNLHYEQAARELILASALYRCGDKDGVGRDALMAYTRDLRGAFAAYAARALAH
ncbi:FAD-dependent oxidoreductase, partial [bacterium]|nr:FAD-dependent oxidoreductase [bacterium]